MLGVGSQKGKQKKAALVGTLPFLINCYRELGTESLDSHPSATAAREASCKSYDNQEHGDDADDTDHGSDIATDRRENRGPSGCILAGVDTLSDDDGEHGN